MENVGISYVPQLLDFSDLLRPRATIQATATPTATTEKGTHDVGKDA